MNEVAGVMGCFSARVQALLHRHLPSSGMCRYLLRFLHPPQPHQDDMAHEGQKLVAYAYMNALAIRKILKKYDKVLDLPAPPSTSLQKSCRGRRLDSCRGRRLDSCREGDWIYVLVVGDWIHFLVVGHWIHALLVGDWIHTLVGN
jgi:hypothetical protein